MLMYSRSAACGSGDWLRAVATWSTASLQSLSNFWSFGCGELHQIQIKRICGCGVICEAVVPNHRCLEVWLR